MFACVLHQTSDAFTVRDYVIYGHCILDYMSDLIMIHDGIDLIKLP